MREHRGAPARRSTHRTAHVWLRAPLPRRPLARPPLPSAAVGPPRASRPHTLTMYAPKPSQIRAIKPTTTRRRMAVEPSSWHAVVVASGLPRRAEARMRRAAFRTCSSVYWRSLAPALAEVAGAAAGGALAAAGGCAMKDAALDGGAAYCAVFNRAGMTKLDAGFAPSCRKKAMVQHRVESVQGGALGPSR